MIAMIETTMMIKGYQDDPLYLRLFAPETQGTRIILGVHGFAEYSSRYRNWARRFVDKNCLFYIYDQRGHGMTPGPKGVILDYGIFLEDLKLVVEKIHQDHPTLPIILYAHSMGGNIALNYLMKKQPKEISLAVISSPWLRLKKETPLFLVRLMEKVFGPAHLVTTKLHSLSHDKGYLKEIADPALVHKEIGTAMAKGIMEGGRSILAHSQLLHTPILLLSAGEDRIVSKKAIDRFAASGNPFITYKSWPGLFHELHNEFQRDEVFDYVWAYLTKEHSN